jgi:hypothetical protein
VAQFRYSETTITNQNLIQEEIKRKLNSGIGCNHSVQNLLFSRLLSKDISIKIYKTIILLVVLYECEAWSLTLREHKLRVFENRVLRIFGSKRDEVTEGCRKLHNEELHNLYSSASIMRMIKSRRIVWAGYVTLIGKMNSHRILVGKPGRKRPLGRPRFTWVDNIKIDLRGKGWVRTKWLHLAQDNDPVSTLMSLRVL